MAENKYIKFTNNLQTKCKYCGSAPNLSFVSAYKENLNSQQLDMVPYAKIQLSLVRNKRYSGFTTKQKTDQYGMYLNNAVMKANLWKISKNNIASEKNFKEFAQISAKHSPKHIYEDTFMYSNKIKLCKCNKTIYVDPKIYADTISMKPGQHKEIIRLIRNILTGRKKTGV